jgi:HEAT repeat protein
MKSNVSALISALSSVDAASRTQAAEQLIVLGTDAQPAAVALVLACGDEDEGVRQSATSALEQMGPPEASDVGQLISLIEAKSPDVGYSATSAYSSTTPPAGPSCCSSSHPTRIHYKALIGECNKP